MRILFITQYFDPEPYFLLPLARELVRRGHSVEVLTGFPNYPNGKIYPGYHQKLCMREEIQGIPVIRTPLYASHDRSAIRRIGNYVSLAATQSLWGIWQVSKPDVAYVMQGPATIGLPACMCKWLRHVPFVYHIQDLWPDSLTSTGMFSNQTGIKLIHKWCGLIYRQAAHIVVLAPGMKRCLIQRGVPENKIDVVYNWADENQPVPTKPDFELAEKLGMKGRFNIVFAGNLGKAQGLETVVNAALLLQDKASNLQFVFVGEGVEKEALQKLVQEKGLRNIRFNPFQPPSEIGKVFCLADVLLVHLRDDPLFEFTIPSKIQAYLRAGRPILAAVSGDAANLVEQAGAGIVCPPENAVKLAEAALTLYNMSTSDREMAGQRGNHFYSKHMSFLNAAELLETVIKKFVQCTVLPLCGGK